MALPLIPLALMAGRAIMVVGRVAKAIPAVARSLGGVGRLAAKVGGAAIKGGIITSKFLGKGMLTAAKTVGKTLSVIRKAGVVAGSFVAGKMFGKEEGRGSGGGDNRDRSDPNERNSETGTPGNQSGGPGSQQGGAGGTDQSIASAIPDLADSGEDNNRENDRLPEIRRKKRDVIFRMITRVIAGERGEGAESGGRLNLRPFLDELKKINEEEVDEKTRLANERAANAADRKAWRLKIANFMKATLARTAGAVTAAPKALWNAGGNAVKAGLLLLAGSLLYKFFAQAQKKFDSFIDEINNSISSVWKGIEGWLNEIGETISTNFSDALGGIKAWWEGSSLKEIAGGFFESTSKIFKEVSSTISLTLDEFFTSVKSMVARVTAGWEDLTDWIKESWLGELFRGMFDVDDEFGRPGGPRPTQEEVNASPTVGLTRPENNPNAAPDPDSLLNVGPSPSPSPTGTFARDTAREEELAKAAAANNGIDPSIPKPKEDLAAITKRFGISESSTQVIMDGGTNLTGEDYENARKFRTILERGELNGVLSPQEIERLSVNLSEYDPVQLTAPAPAGPIATNVASNALARMNAPRTPEEIKTLKEQIIETEIKLMNSRDPKEIEEYQRRIDYWKSEIKKEESRPTASLQPVSSSGLITQQITPSPNFVANDEYTANQPRFASNSWKADAKTLPSGGTTGTVGTLSIPAPPPGKARIAWTREVVTNEYLKRGYTQEQAEAGGKLAAAQYAQEVGWKGRSAIAQNNFFNIKDPDNKFGDMKHSPKVYDKSTKSWDHYAQWSTPEGGVKGYVDFLERNPRYTKHGVLQASTYEDKVERIKAAGFAEDPNYVKRLNDIPKGRSWRESHAMYEEYKKRIGISTETPIARPLPTKNSELAPGDAPQYSLEQYRKELGATRVSSEFGPRKSPTAGASSNHKGVDFAAARGTPVRMPSVIKEGKVTYAGVAKGYGNVVYVAHPDGSSTRYAHLHTINVNPGESVSSSTVLGTVGNTGVGTGNHLHFEYRDASGVARNPKEVFAGKRAQPSAPVPLPKAQETKGVQAPQNSFKPQESRSDDPLSKTVSADGALDDMANALPGMEKYLKMLGVSEENSNAILKELKGMLNASSGEVDISLDKLWGGSEDPTRTVMDQLKPGQSVISAEEFQRNVGSLLPSFAEQPLAADWGFQHKGTTSTSCMLEPASLEHHRGIADSLEKDTAELQSASNSATSLMAISNQIPQPRSSSQDTGATGFNRFTAPLITRNTDSSIRRVADAFMAYGMP